MPFWWYTWFHCVVVPASASVVLAMLNRYELSGIIRWLAVAAGIFLTFRKGASAKWFDIIALTLFFALVFDRAGWETVRRNAGKLLHITLLCAGIVGFIVLAELFNPAFGLPPAGDAPWNYVRLAGNFLAFFTAVLLAARGREAFWAFSIAVLLAPITVFPAFGNLDEGTFIHGGRLAGHLQNPIIFGAWTLVSFLLGLGMFMVARKRWAQTALFVWLIVLGSFLLWSATRAAWLTLGVAVGLFSLVAYLRTRDARAGMFPIVVTICTVFLGYFLLPSRGIDMKTFVALRSADLTVHMVTLRPWEVGAQAHVTRVPQAMQFLVHHPRGTGFSGDVPQGPYAPNGKTPSPLNTLLELGIYGGFGALACFVILLYILFRSSFFLVRDVWRGVRKDDAQYWWVVIGIAFFADMLFTQAFLWRHAWVVFGAVLGVAYLEPRDAGPSPGAATS